MKQTGLEYINVTHLSLRKTLGILGIALPFILILGNKLDILPSISHFYYSQMSVFFTGVLSAYGLFLFSYRGYEKEKKGEKLSDNWLTNAAGVLILLTAVIPTASANHACIAPFSHNSKLFDTLHLIFAAGFFVIMGWMAYFKFTRSNNKIKRLDTEIKIKQRRNRIYRICGIGVWVSLFLLALVMIFNLDFTGSDVFIGETAALLFFGTAWLVKSKALKKVGF
jgi:hypothetical protein